MQRTLSILYNDPRLPKTIVYTIGHILIAMSCIMIITGSSVGFASLDAIIEPLINAVWFYMLEKVMGDRVRTLRTVIYTMGHIIIATICTLIITGSELEYAFIDAVIEPSINGIWYMILDKLWTIDESNYIRE